MKMLRRDPEHYMKGKIAGTSHGSVLDVGCGIRPVFSRWIPELDKTRYIGVDAYQSYIDVCCDKWKGVNFMCQPAPPLDFEDNSFDFVILDDVIEHLEKDQGAELFREAKRIARRGVTVSSPNGFLAQSPHNTWGVEGGDTWQEHRSGWEPEEFNPKEVWLFWTEVSEDGWFLAWCPV